MHPLCGCYRQDKIRPLWRHYYSNTDAVLFFVDSSDKASFDGAKAALKGALDSTELSGAPVLLMVNKQDLAGVASVEEVRVHFGLEKLAPGRKAHVHGCSSTSGEGLQSGLKWLAGAVAK